MFIQDVLFPSLQVSLIISLSIFVQGQSGWSSDQPGLVEDVPADGRGIGTR